jgi:nucleotide-binding universal stress UspA family protein
VHPGISFVVFRPWSIPGSVEATSSAIGARQDRISALGHAAERAVSMSCRDLRGEAMAMGGHERGPVVVGVDSSDSARHASEWAADLAATWHAPLRLVHTVRDGGDAAEVPPWLRELLDGAERVGAEPAGAEVVAGAVDEVLLDRSGAAGLLVVGSYGEGARAGMLAGSTALALLDGARCPVAVVRGSAPQLPPPRRGPVVVGADASAVGEAALDLAADLAAASGARVVAVHAWTDVVADASGGLHRVGSGGTELAARAVELLDALVKRVRDRHPDLDVERHAVNDTALRALLEQARGARVVVVGHRGRASAVGRLGSTSRGLVEFAPCPVVVT